MDILFKGTSLNATVLGKKSLEEFKKELQEALPHLFPEGAGEDKDALLEQAHGACVAAVAGDTGGEEAKTKKTKAAKPVVEPAENGSK